MPNNDYYLSEQQLLNAYQAEIKSCWQTGTFSSFQGVRNCRVNFATFIQPQHSKSLIIVPGRGESYLKYQEVIYNFHQLGFNIFIIDHRGQGFSQRLLNNRFKGFVTKFSDYVDDLAHFIDNYVLPIDKQPYLLAHSMGCAISALYLAQQPNNIKAAVFSSPMFAINLGKLPQSVANGLIHICRFIEHYIPGESRYFWGQKDQQIKPFAENKISHSKIRYQIYQNLYQQEQAIQLGGVTMQWLLEAYQLTKPLYLSLAKIKCPIQVLQAGSDIIVDNTVQNKFCEKLHQSNAKSCPEGKAVRISGAKHELLFEADEYRKPALTAIINWFESH